jgi:hypothetical protein
MPLKAILMDIFMQNVILPNGILLNECNSAKCRGALQKPPFRKRAIVP